MSTSDMNRHTVSQVARMAHVTVRTLHHYDEIGLLVPAERSGKGYRIYDEGDLQRLHQILVFRELGFSLEGIHQILDAPAFERVEALRAQRELLKEGIRKTEAVIRAVDAALDALERGRPMESKKIFEGFEEFDHGQYEDEARERWGKTEAYKESMRRTKQYTREDWARIKAEGESVEARLADLCRAGKSPEDPEVMDAAEAHRLHMDRSFYPVSHAMHVGLGRMYVSDPRFTAHYEERAEGLAAFVAGAIEANARRAGATLPPDPASP
jgi:DNA-binding transcriptional MerR regulator